METLENVEQFVQLDSVQFQELVEKIDLITECQLYISDIGLALLCFVALACGILLGNIFSRYMRG